eukprot:9209671-Ditylum_brightwellii.AAC.1
MAVMFYIYAEYHKLALSSETKEGGGEPDWTMGKRQAQEIMRQYLAENMLPQLHRAAKEELQGSNPLTRTFRDTKKRRQMLLSFVHLNWSFCAMHPISCNSTHPRFPELEKAVLRACKRDQVTMLPAEICSLMEQPQERFSLEGHTNTVNCCAVFAGGTRAVSGSDDKTLRVWDLKTCKMTHKLQGHSDGVSCCAVFTDETHIVSGSRDKTIKVWNLETCRQIHTLEGHTAGVICCAVFYGGTLVISGSYDKTIKLWNLETGKETRTFRGHTGAVN